VISHRMQQTLIASLLSFAAARQMAAQDCASAPQLGRRIAVGAALSHSSFGESGLSTSLTGRIIADLRLGGAYQATRFNDVDRLAHEGRISLSAPVSLAGLELCPTASGAYAHLATDKSTMHGRVDTRDARIGTSIGRTFDLAQARRVTPFVEPLFARRNVSWQSVDGSWRVAGNESASEAQFWLGLSFATPRSAVVARLRPKRGSAPREFSVGIVTAFGGR
jgi:hypothetical protein